MTDFALACRDCAFGLLRTAREYREMGNRKEVERLVQRAKFHWLHYKLEIWK